MVDVFLKLSNVLQAVESSYTELPGICTANDYQLLCSKSALFLATVAAFEKLINRELAAACKQNKVLAQQV